MDTGREAVGFSRHITRVAHELDDAEKLSFEALRQMGYRSSEARYVIRVSRLIRNIIDSIYVEKRGLL